MMVDNRPMWERSHPAAIAEVERLQELLRGIDANRYWEGRWRDEKAEIERLRAALNDIAHPLQGMERRAKASGCVVNYPMAQGLAEQPSYLRGLARDALSGHEQKANKS